MGAYSGYQVKLIRGGVEGIRSTYDHLAGTDKLDEPFYKELGPAQLSALTGLLARENSYLIGEDQPAEKTPDNISRYIANTATGAKRVGAVGVILTQGKGLSLLAATDAEIRAAVLEAQKKGRRSLCGGLLNRGQIQDRPGGFEGNGKVRPWQF